MNPEPRRVLCLVFALPLVVSMQSCQMRDATQQRASYTTEKDRLLDSAERIAAAAILYERSNSDTLPGPQDFAIKLRPLLRDGSLHELDSFEWSYPGGKVAETSSYDKSFRRLGTIDGKTGYAVAFLDGHARWFLR